MRLHVVKSKNAASLYVIESTYIGGKHSSRVVEKLGTVEALTQKLGGQDPIEWAKAYIQELNRKEKEGTREVVVRYSPMARVQKDEQRSFNGGYLFLQKIYHELGLHKVCAQISRRHPLTYDLDGILSRLVYARLLYPSSKLTMHQISARFLEQPSFELQHVNRALELLAKETEFIQSSLYSSSLARSNRNTGVLYYGCANYSFEVEQEARLKQCGVFDELHPNQPVQLGLFMDADGIPLAFHLNKGSADEPPMLTPLEEKIRKDFSGAKVVVCTDDGLAATDDPMLNNPGMRAYLTTQSFKELDAHLKAWALDPHGWCLPADQEQYNLQDLKEYEGLEQTFYKDRWINEEGFGHRLLVTYSLRDRSYYGVRTNLAGDGAEIVKLIRRRLEMEECFRIIKNEFYARLSCLSPDDRITAHFTSCFLSLILSKYLERRLGNRYTCSAILQCLTNMTFFLINDNGYIPTYTRNDLTDALHEVFDFRMDYEITTLKQMKKILSLTKQT